MKYVLTSRFAVSETDEFIDVESREKKSLGIFSCLSLVSDAARGRLRFKTSFCKLISICF